jgi:HlyD family secretion protein
MIDLITDFESGEVGMNKLVKINNGISGRPGASKPAQGAKRPSRAEVEQAVSTLIRWAGDDPDREGLMFVNFNDFVKVGQPIARLDQEIFAAGVNGARAALRVARATAQVQEAALERARVMVGNAQTGKSMVEAQTAAAKARQDEAEREFQRKLELARSGSVAARELSQAQALRDSGAADLRASLVQIQLKEEAISIARAEQRMAEANLENARADIEQKQAALDQGSARSGRSASAG